MPKRTKEGAICGPAFGKLNAADRRAIPSALFGLPTQRKYPMPDSSHAKNAKGRARQQLNKKNLSTADYFKVTSKANTILQQCLVPSKKKKAKTATVADIGRMRAPKRKRKRKVA